MKRNSIIVLVILLAFCFINVGMAAAKAKGNERKGKYFFRKNCRECHKPGGSAKQLGPDSKTMKQWKKAFTEKKIAKLECKDEWAKQTDKELNDVFSYLYNHAYDSPSPAKCK
ncbi:c-type cytochrome [Thermodesulfobacteriota bacterium]